MNLSGDEPRRGPATPPEPNPEAESAENPARGYFVDPSRGSTPFEPEYALWFGDERREPHYGRAALELLGVLVIGTSYYWIVSDPNKVDWDYVNLEDRALHTDVKFDNNMFRTNFLLHPLAGTMSYWLSRVNDLDVYASLANAALSSAAFEFLLEWLEKPSINDLIVTPFGGVAGGEFFFHLGDYLNSARGHENALQRFFAYSVGVPQGIHRSLNGDDEAPPSTSDALGYSSAYWHRFGVSYGLAEVSNDAGSHGTVNDLVFDSRLVAMPGFLRPGHFSVDFQQGNFTEARLRTSIARGLLQDVDLFIGADLVGHYQQNYSGTPESLRGSAWMLAASMDMRYVDRWVLDRRDQFAAFHFLGPSAKLWLALGGGLVAKAEGRLHIDLVGMRSPAYEQLASQYGTEGTKSVLQLQDYYQGMGGSGKIGMAVGFQGLELGGRAAYGTYRSVDGLDRYESPRDATNFDQISELGASLEYAPPVAPIALRTEWGQYVHASSMGPISVRVRDRRLSTGVGFVF
jgi:hypothetical protein